MYIIPVCLLYTSNYPGYTEGWATYTEMQSFYYAGLDPDLASLLQHNQAATLSLYACLLYTSFCYFLSNFSILVRLKTVYFCAYFTFLCNIL